MATSTLVLILSNLGCNLCFFSLLIAADWGLGDEAVGVAAALAAALAYALSMGDSRPMSLLKSLIAPSTELLAAFNLLSWLYSSDYFFLRASAAALAFFSFSAVSSKSAFYCFSSSAIFLRISAAASFDSLSCFDLASSASANCFLTYSAFCTPSTALAMPVALVNCS